jgi:hypothetical protein
VILIIIANYENSANDVMTQIEWDSQLKEQSKFGKCLLLISEAVILSYYYNYYMVQCRIFFEKLIVAQLVKQPAFLIEPKGSLPCSQKSATGPYPEPAKSNSPHQSLSP